MEADQISNIDKIGALAEKYGLALVLSIVLMAVVLYIVRMLVKGELVPRSLLDHAVEDRDRLQAILDKEREGVMAPLLDVVKNLKKDEDREG